MTSAAHIEDNQFQMHPTIREQELIKGQLLDSQDYLKTIETSVDESQEASYDLLSIYNLIDIDMIMPVKLLQASGLHVYVLATFWRVWGAHLPSVPPILLF